MKKRLNANPVPVVVPIGAEDQFEGVVDLIKMKGIIWDAKSQGMTFEYVDIPANLVDVAQEWHEKMVESAAEASEELMNKYLENGELSEEDIIAGLRQRTIACEIQPMLCGSAFKTRACSACSTPSCSSCRPRPTFRRLKVSTSRKADLP